MEGCLSLHGRSGFPVQRIEINPEPPYSGRTRGPRRFHPRRAIISSIAWLRRDLRRADLPLLAAAHDDAGEGGEVVVAFVLDPAFYDGAGAGRQAWLAANLLALRQRFEGRMTLLSGDPTILLPELAARCGATSVHASTETEPQGAARDAAVREALAAQGVEWVETGSAYAVTPGRVRTQAGGPYSVFTPFAKAWRAHGWRAPAVEPADLRLAPAMGDDAVWSTLEQATQAPGLPTLPEAGEGAAMRRWEAFLEEGLDDYAWRRDRADLDGTSLMSLYLAFGVVHPRTLLADLAERRGDGAERFVTELAWREFYADVLHHHPDSLWADLRPALAGMEYEQDEQLLTAWQHGRTGYPFVDAGMRQLLATGWMHNRVRMVTASFLTKDLHVWWPVGAEWFLQHLLDGDRASNAHGWQWVAGTGTDASPYFRIFNPVSQGLRFDPQGDYVRRWIPELAHLPGASAHEPWKSADGYAGGYPERVVDHAEERRVALSRYGTVRGTEPND